MNFLSSGQFFTSLRPLLVHCEHPRDRIESVGMDCHVIQQKSVTLLDFFKMVAVAAVLAVAAIGLLTYWLFKIERLRLKLDQLKGPRSIPILGNSHQLKRTPRGNCTIMLFLQRKLGRCHCLNELRTLFLLETQTLRYNMCLCMHATL